jgi:hypothetical protein
MGDIDPREVLRDARQCVKSREYAAALEKYIWFHDHALDANRFLAGVRTSYAISEWVDLGEAYSPALTALETLRDRKTESLIHSTQETTVFHDVTSINRALGQVERTRDLFKIIADDNRGFADKCFRFALESLVCTKEFGLARSFMLDVRSEVDRFAIPFKSAPQSTPSASKEMVQEILVQIYVKNVGLLLQVLIGVGEEVEAKRIRQYALDCVTDQQLRDMVMERLFPSPPRGSIQ